MTLLHRPRAWRGPPLSLQILALLVGGLLVAQGVTLLLTLLLPPEPPARYGLSDIAEALRAPEVTRSGLQREILAAAPDTSGRGWLMADSSRADLARLLGTGIDDVRLSFYTPLPFAGTVALPAASGDNAIGDARRSGPEGGMMPAALLVWRGEPVGLRSAGDTFPDQGSTPAMRLVQVAPGGGVPGGPLAGRPGGGFPGGGFPGGGFPGGGFPGRDLPRGGLPGGGVPGGGAAGAQLPDAIGGSLPSARNGAGGVTGASSPVTGPATPTSTGLSQSQTPAGLSATGGDAARTLAPAPPIAAPSLSLPSLRPPILPTTPPQRTATPDRTPGTAVPQPLPASPSRLPEAVSAAPSVTQDTPALRPVVPAPLAAATDSPSRSSDLRDAAPLPTSGFQGALDQARGLLGLGPSPFVQGDFVAAWRLADGRWMVVHPAAASFLSAWQKRVVLWFLLSLAVVAPLGWLFARRLSRPLDRFAEAAAQLGRDPSTAIAPLDGPAEIGRAAHAFNLMQTRLRSFVDDRTAMIGAISHDLRTPITRLRFRIEEVPDDVRDGMLHDVEEMEAMIGSVLSFMRDASTQGVRERLDLRTLLDDVAEDAAVTGAEVPIAASQPATVEVEVMGMRRVLANLLENALKYGRHARMELSLSPQEAIAAIIDDGPGIPDEELEQVFQPFYRTAAARVSSAPGTGLGLAVCRSIARAHGGDVRLYRSDAGFRAEVRVPLVYAAQRAMAA